MIHLTIADDHAIFRLGLMELLAREADFRVLAQSDNGDRALQDICDFHPHVAVLDMTMPGMNGIEIIQEARRRKQSTNCILLTVHDDPEIAATAFRSGAAGYLLKNHTFKEICQVVRTVASGKKHFAPELIPLLTDRPQLHKTTLQLTRREQEILRLVTRGLTVKEIASELRISERTVDTHKTHIMSKLDIHSTPALVSYALRNKLVSDA